MAHDHGGIVAARVDGTSELVRPREDHALRRRETVPLRICGAMIHESDFPSEARSKVDDRQRVWPRAEQQHTGWQGVRQPKDFCAWVGSLDPRGKPARSVPEQ